MFASFMPVFLLVGALMPPVALAVLPDECSSLPAVPAATRLVYVDQDDPLCGPAGSSTQPLCALQPALDTALPGDSIRVRRSVQPYRGPFVLTRSGTVTQPIILENDPGQQQPIFSHGGPVIAGVSAALYLEDNDYVVVRLLVFDGFDTPSLNAAIHHHTKNRNTAGIDIRRNKIRNWAGKLDGGEQTAQSILLTRNYPRRGVGHAVRCNTLQNNRSEGIRMTGTFDTLIAYNDISGQRCSLTYDGNNVLHGESVAIKVSNASAFDANGNKVTEFLNPIVRGNLIADPDQHCEEAEAAALAADGQGGIWCDVGAAGGLAEYNVLTNALGNTDWAPKWGVHIESRCDNWTVRNNTVRSVNVFPFTSPLRARNTNGTAFTNNLVCGGERQLWVLDNSGKALTVSGNNAYGGVRPLNVTNATVNGTLINGWSTNQLRTFWLLNNTWEANLSLCPAP